MIWAAFIAANLLMFAWAFIVEWRKITQEKTFDAVQRAAVTAAEKGWYPTVFEWEGRLRDQAALTISHHSMADPWVLRCPR